MFDTPGFPLVISIYPRWSSDAMISFLRNQLSESTAVSSDITVVPRLTIVEPTAAHHELGAQFHK